MPGQPPADSWRRGLRLSVRALMVVVLVTGGGIGWVMYRAASSVTPSRRSSKQGAR